MNETELSAYERGRTETEAYFRWAIADRVALALQGAMDTSMNRISHDETRRITQMILDGTDDGTVEGACERFMWEDVNGYTFVSLVRGLLKSVRQA